MANLPLFDANCRVGRHLELREGGLHTPADLLAEMDHHGIAEALVMDPIGCEQHPQAGNERVLSVTQHQTRFHPAWSAIPPGAGEQPDPEALVEAMQREKVGALFLFPNRFKFNLSDWCIDALVEPLADAGVPLFINYNAAGPAGGAMDMTDWKDVVALCRRHPNLPVIVSEHRIRRSQRLIYRALDACPGLHIELSGYWLYHGVEYITRRWGAERLIFGSNWPTFGPHMTLAMLSMASIPESDKRLIAGDNLRGLINWCDIQHPCDTEIPQATDSYVAFGRSGEHPEAMRFADCHGHIGPHANHYHIPDAALDDVVEGLDRLGVDKVCVFGFTGVFSDEQPGNDHTARAVARYPDRFIGFTMLNPHRGEAGMLAELERGAAMGLRGVKLIAHYQGYPEDGPLIDVACRWAHERHQIILNHNWGPVQNLSRLMDRYPNACYLTGHTTTAYADLMTTHSNLYVCSCPLLSPRACEDVVAQIGADRLMFGSDLEDLPPPWGLGPILFARIPEEQKRLILGDNLRKVLETYSREP